MLNAHRMNKIPVLEIKKNVTSPSVSFRVRDTKVIFNLVYFSCQRFDSSTYNIK